MSFRLTGDLRGTPINLLLRPGINILGSGSSCDVKLNHPSVSRRHAQIVVEPEAARLCDLGSRNGTFLNSRMISEGEAREGDMLTFGLVNLRLNRVPVEDEAVGAVTPEPSSRPAARRESSESAFSTVGTHAMENFVTEHLPRLTLLLRQQADIVRMAQAGGSVIFENLPVLRTEIASRGTGMILFQASRPGALTEKPGDEAIRLEGDALALSVAFAHEGAASLYRPLASSVLELIELASGAPPPSSPPERKAARPPEPESVVPAVRKVFQDAARVARSNVGVLICGESGTGKEILARYIHASSPRADSGFFALNCAAIARDLLEVELFGIERGVATGVEARPGKFELADGGTLFLDEIGDMSVETQSRILRVLQEGEVYRVGGNVPRKARARVVAATNRDMEALLAAGKFREDLYYRIATWVVELPPLRHRPEDIANLAVHFLSREARANGLSVAGISKGALDLLLAYPWPGNIRQLEKEMGRAALFLSEGDILDSKRLSAELRHPQRHADARTLAEKLRLVERAEIEKSLDQHDGDVDLAAHALGVPRSTLYRRMKALHIEIDSGTG